MTAAELPATPVMQKRAKWSSVWMLTGAHTIHDMSLGFLGVALPFLRERLGFSLFLAGLLSPAQQAGSLAQPVLGHFADNVGKRRFVIAFLALTPAVMSLMGLSLNYVMLLVVVAVGGLSSAAYHPAGSALVTGYAGDRWGTGLAIYHFGGNIGLALGPVGAAFVISEFGLRATWMLAIPGLLWALLLAKLVQEPADSGAKRSGGKESAAWLWEHRGPLAVLWVIVFGTAVGAGGLGLFLPSLLLERDYSLTLSALLTSGFFVIGGIGGLLSGWLSDRIGRRQVISMTLVLAPVCLLGFLMLEGPLAVAFLMVASISLRGEQPVIMALIQEWAPERRGTVVGFVLGVQFVLAGLGSAAVGFLAEEVGLNHAFRIVALVPLLGLPLVHRLPYGRL